MLSTLFLPAGNGAFDRFFPLEPEDPAVPDQTVRRGGVEANLSGRRVTVTCSRETIETWSPAGMPGGKLTAGKACPVEGLFGDVQKLFLDEIGPGHTLFLFALNRSGGLEMVNLTDGARYGKLTALPVPGISDAVKVENGEAVDRDGRHFALARWKQASETGADYLLTEDCTWVTDAIEHRLDSGGSYRSIYFLEFGADNTLTVDSQLPDVGTGTVSRGAYHLAGMTGEGTFYRFDLRGEGEESAYAGTAVLRYLPTEGESVQAEIKILSGTELFDRPGEFVLLNRAEKN